MAVSSKFNKMAGKDKFDKARHEENQLSGCPLPIGTEGTAVISSFEATETKKGIPAVYVELSVEEPEEYQGKKLSGPGLMWFVKEGPKSTEEDAFQRMLDGLEQVGLPREIRENYEEFIQVGEWFDDEPRRVRFVVLQDDYSGNASGKTVRANAIMEGEGTSADDSPEEAIEADCTYLSKPHKLISEDGDMVTIQGVASGRTREVERSKVTFPDKG